MHSTASYPRIVLVLLLSWCGGTWSDEAVRPPWVDDEAVVAAMKIGMSDSQRPQFVEAVKRFVVDLGEQRRKLLTRNNVPDIDGQIERKTNSLAGRMDKTVSEFLAQAQMPAYLDYRRLLLVKLTASPDNPSGESLDNDIRFSSTGHH